MTAQKSKFSIFLGIILSAFKRSNTEMHIFYRYRFLIGVFLGDLLFLPHLTIDSAQNDWNNLDVPSKVLFIILFDNAHQYWCFKNCTQCVVEENDKLNISEQLRNGFHTENMSFSVAGIILPNEALNPDVLQLVMKIHYNSTHAQLLSNRM